MSAEKKKTDQETKLKLFEMENTSYIFIPFSFGDSDRFRPLVGALKESDHWIQILDKVKYMHRFVAGKLDYSNEETCQCFHFRLNDSYRSEYGLPDDGTWCTMRYKKAMYRFIIRDVQLFLFTTTIGIIAFRITLEETDPFRISDAQYYLKKVSRQPFELGSPDNKSNMLDISKNLMDGFADVCSCDFFYYSCPGEERANLLSFTPAEPKEDFSKELFFLRRCYGEGYRYVKDAGQEQEELLSPSDDVHWGISPEAAACIVCPEASGRSSFISGTLFKNFNSQYLLMYVLLLHQKYALYLFQTRMSTPDRSDLVKLEEYRSKLYEFEADFVFSCITEVPQYQLLYEKMTAAFALRKMFEDVHEPLTSLGEVRRQAEEKEQEKRDRSLENALIMITMLSIFSAWVDSYDFFGEFLKEMLGAGEVAVRAVQLLCFALVIAIGIYVLYTQRKIKRK